MTDIRIYVLALLTVCFLVLPSQAALNPDNIMGMWLFDEGNGNTAKDSSQNGNDGKINGGAKWVDGQFGKAIQFNGSDVWVEVPHSDSVSFEKGTSFSITVHYKGIEVAGSLVGKNYEDTSQAKPWYLLWSNTGNKKVSFYLRTTNDVNSRIESAEVVSDDEWHFIAAVADADSKKISLWIDGKKSIEDKMDTSDGYGTAEGVFHIGRHHDRYTNGIIDDVGLFNVALSEDEMNTIMKNGLVEAAAVDAVGKLTTTWGKIKRQLQ